MEKPIQARDKRVHCEFCGVVGTLIRQERNALGLSQRELAQKVGIDRVSLTSMEEGRQHIPVHLLYLLAAALNMPVTGLLP